MDEQRTINTRGKDYDCHLTQLEEEYEYDDHTSFKTSLRIMVDQCIAQDASSEEFAVKLTENEASSKLWTAGEAIETDQRGTERDADAILLKLKQQSQSQRNRELTKTTTDKTS